MAAVKGLFRKIRRLGFDGLYQRLDTVLERIDSPSMSGASRRQMEALRVQVGDLQARHVRSLPDHSPLSRAEFKVFSQFGDDGILQYIFSRIAAVDSFIEFGVEDYTESNTRFLLLHDNWRGLILDGRPDLKDVLSSQGLPFLHDLTVRSAFITAENINQLLVDAGYSGEIGLLSIDIDGNDYWIWKALDVVNPQVVVVEYNAVFGAHHAVTIPYDSSFQRSRAHTSWLYFGASLRALCQLGESKGYTFIGCNAAGNNAYFVQKGLASRFQALHPLDGFVDSRFRESRDGNGRMNQLSSHARLEAIANAPVLNLETGETMLLAEILL